MGRSPRGYLDPALGRRVRLSLDPLTQNRYGFACGNPVSFVETDGHALTGVDEESGGGCVSVAACTDPWYAIKQPIADVVSQIRAGVSGAWESAKPGIRDVAYDLADSGNAYARAARQLSYGVADSGYGALEKVFGTRDAENLPGGVLLVNNARGPVGAVVGIWGETNTMTLGANLIVSRRKLATAPPEDVLRHELVHVDQARTLGEPLYVGMYLTLWIPTFVAWGFLETYGGQSIDWHDLHPMEIHAQISSGLAPVPSWNRPR